MKIEVSKLKPLIDNVFDEDIVFDEEIYAPHLPLLKVNNAHVTLSVHNYDEFIDVNIKLKADVVLQCSYSLKPFKKILNATDDMHFANNDDDEDFIHYKGNVIEMDKYVFDLLSASIPASPKAPGAKLPNDGKGYRILSEDDLKREKESKVNSKFDALLDIDFDD